MQSLKYLIALLLFGIITDIYGQGTDVLYRVNNVPYATTVAHSFTDSEVIPRLRNTDSAVPTRYTEVVKGYLNTYTVKNREKTERILGKAVMYFPIFEAQFRKSGLPESLKYLSVTESALNPVAVSSAKAVGLWQFMKATGQEYGLRIDQAIDERCDPHLSTAAAAAYLQKQYKRFGDWALAIAAYNSGPGNVSKAIRRGRSKNFWKIKKYLPRETRSYVPGYIAAAYILQYYEQHGLIPQYPEMDLQLTEAVKIYRFINFQTIATMTGLSMHTIKELNPSFLQNYIPNSQRGYHLILPKRVMANFRKQLARPDRETIYTPESSVSPIYVAQTVPVFTNDNYQLSHHVVQHNEHLNTIAKLYNCHPYHIKIWNDLQSNYVQPGQNLKIYIPKVITNPVKRKAREKRVVPPIRTLIPAPITTQQTSTIATLKNTINSATKNGLKNRRYVYHLINRYESLRDISRKYGTPVKKILKYNNVKRGRSLMPGDKIKVKLIELE